MRIPLAHDYEVVVIYLYLYFMTPFVQQGATCASYKLAKSVIKTCAEVDDELNSLVCKFISSCIHDRDAVDCELKEYYHEIIFEIFQCAPHMLVPIFPSLIEELNVNPPF
jgi:sister-chromatid-cohesion protein PDS5